MSLNIAPHIPQVIVNSAAPATESLAHANSIKEVVPAPTQVEAAVPQKSREQDARPPSNQSAVTYEGLQQQSDSRVIPEGEEQEQPAQQEQNAQSDGDEQEQSGQETQTTQASTADTSDNDEAQDQERAEQTAEARVEQAQQRAELAQIRQLEQRDAEVRAHEQAHAAVGGSYAGSPSYDYQTGPNGKKYAVGGEVPIDVSEGKTPQETIRKMQTVRAAALAPAEPSSQDRKVAAEASLKLAEARADLINETTNLQQSRSAGLDSEEVESDEFQINTDNPIGQEPRKRSLAGVESSQESNSVEFNQTEIESLAKQRDEDVERTASVISNRYADSYQTQERGFSAVA